MKVAIDLAHFESLIKKYALAKNISYQEAMSFLEEAHLLSQPYATYHLYVHWKMFLLAFRFKVWSEVLGQIPRLLLAMPGSILGMAPKGNVGSTKMGIFEERQ
jgi:hypothetical protein